ncbi:DUF4123 domain-containing protein [Pseudoxanthomonas mexicana]|uniref:DUF4123 domain-containing protein n=1 Tax=Pseudoxanthomonas mexicana TaxID=128785 RepID=UPI00398B60C9
MSIAAFIPLHDWKSPSNGEQRFLLLDGAQCKSVEDILKRIPDAGTAIHLFDGVLADGSADASVYLLRLSENMDLAAFLRCAAPALLSWGGVGLIDSSLPPGELSQRLMRRLGAKFANGKEFLQRFFDGRVFPMFIDVLTPEQREAFLAVGSRWWFVGPDLSWQSLELTDPASDPYSGPQQFSDAQRRRIVDDTYPYTLMDHFSFTDKELLDRIPPRDRYRFFRHCMRIAEQFGIRDGKRIVMICTWALLLGDKFHQDPAWVARLEDFAAGRRTAREIGNEAWPVEETWE